MGHIIIRDNTLSLLKLCCPRLPLFRNRTVKWLKYWDEWKGTSLDGPVWRLLIALDVPEFMKIFDVGFGHDFLYILQHSLR